MAHVPWYGEKNMGNKSNNTSRLNRLLVNLFNKVLEAESRAVITGDFMDISNNDMHIIDAIGVDEPKNMSAIAAKRMVTVGTLTVNMNSLEKKGYIKRERSTEDKRVVYVTLTEKGRKAFFHHRDFHKEMIKAAVRGLEEDEMRALISCLDKLDRFFASDED